MDFAHAKSTRNENKLWTAQDMRRQQAAPLRIKCSVGHCYEIVSVSISGGNQSQYYKNEISLGIFT